MPDTAIVAYLKLELLENVLEGARTAAQARLSHTCACVSEFPAHNKACQTQMPYGVCGVDPEGSFELMEKNLRLPTETAYIDVNAYCNMHALLVRQNIAICLQAGGRKLRNALPEWDRRLA